VTLLDFEIKTVKTNLRFLMRLRVVSSDLNKLEYMYPSDLELDLHESNRATAGIFLRPADPPVPIIRVRPASIPRARAATSARN
jgi:hypothetical protein